MKHTISYMKHDNFNLIITRAKQQMVYTGHFFIHIQVCVASISHVTRLVASGFCVYSPSLQVIFSSLRYVLASGLISHYGNGALWEIQLMSELNGTLQSMVCFQ